VGEAAHHIVAKGARAADLARRKLQGLGISIDAAVNGVFLPSTRAYIGKASNHLTLHTKRYYSEVNRWFADVATKEEAIEVLSRIRNKLLEGTFPR
jgi:hypothetical protein